MMTSPWPRRIALLHLCGALSALAQDPGKPAAGAPGPGGPAPAEAPLARGAADGAITTRRDARAITLKIPAPRGMIVDREGEPFAQSEVAYQVALQFRQFENADRDFVIHWARTRITALAPLVRRLAAPSDDELYDHYRHRRWLPLALTGQLGADEARKIEARLDSGLVLHPVYRRHYPHGGSAAHVIGYTGSAGRLPTGPINFNEPLWEESEGRAGLEKLFHAQLEGEPGMKKLIFDENGNKLLEEQIKRPRPGGTLVTTLHRKWQLLAENVLEKGCKRGAFVVIDAVTGEVLVLASRPSFDLNRFIPGISEADFKALEEDPSTPLYGRAFQSAYPPASSYKPIVALAALQEGVVTESSLVDCPAAIAIGRTVFNNWSKTPEGPIDVKRALARSCNTWFYQVGIDVGPTSFLTLSRRLGLGERSGLPLIGEAQGLVPDDEWMLKHEKRRILDGDTANLSIGQGTLLASPLQVAQAMAGIANGSILPRLRLVRQVQDSHGRVIEAPAPEPRQELRLDPKVVEIVRQGMADVVNGPGGTGRGAGLGFTTLCGKTGTAQWGPKSKNQRLAWFAGFLSAENPRYAFAVLYEGRPGETVSGGRMAAPMVRRFFEGIEDEIKDSVAPPRKALVVVDESADGGAPLKAVPVIDPEGADAGGTAPADVLEEPLRALPAAEEAPPRAVQVAPPLPDEVEEVTEENVEEP